jgi:hypothetical protein
MSLISRNSPNLLQTISGSQQATDEDYERDPESSSDELEMLRIKRGDERNHAENDSSFTSRRKRKVKEPVNQTSALKKQKKNTEDRTLGEIFDMDRPRTVRVSQKLYGSARHGKQGGPLKNIHAESKKEENMDSQPTEIFKSPPNSSLIVHSIREPAKFRLPPALESGQSIKKVGVTFQHPSAATLPTTRSTARTITPEFSKPY